MIAAPFADLIVHDSGVVYSGGLLDYLWFDLDGAGLARRGFRAVRLAMLSYLPREERETVTVLEKTRKALKGLAATHMEFAYLVAGIFDPPIGVVQIYGVIGQSALGKEDAAAQAARGMAALRAVMANFEQSRLAPLDLDKVEWLRRSFLEMPHALAVVGQPDPRENSKGMSAGSNPVQAARQSELSLQQNEMLFRGMARGRHEFLNLVILSRADPAAVFRLQERVAQEASIWASKERFTRGVHVGLSLPVVLSGLLGEGAATGYGTQAGQAVNRAEGESRGWAHSEGQSESESWGQARTEGENWGEAISEGSSYTRTVGRAETAGEADGVSRTETVGHSVTEAQGESHSESQSWAQAEGQSSGWAEALSHGASYSQGIEGGAQVGVSGSGVNLGRSEGVSESFGLTQTQSGGASISNTVGGSETHAVSTSHAETDSRAVSEGASHVESRAVTQSESESFGTFQSRTESHGVSVAETESYARSVGRSQSDTESGGEFESRGESQSQGVVQSQALSLTRGLGVGAGLAPSLSLSKTYQGEDHAATLVANALRGQERLLDTIALEGGLLVDSTFLVRTEGGARALEALVPQAFHGVEDVVTPVRARRLDPGEAAGLRKHAMAFTPSSREEPSRWALEPWRDSTLLSLLQAAAYVAPGVFEEGPATTVQERIPPFAFPPDLRGEVELGHLVSFETGERTPAAVRLSRGRMSNWGFFADTRYGKSVAAERLVLEAVRRWGFRAIVLDFGAGWRRLLPLAPGAFDLWGLYPDSPRPLRWNPLQVGRRVPAEKQLAATVDLFVNAGRMGERQHGFLRRTLRELYLEHGVLTADREVLGHARWGFVQPDEAGLLPGLASGRVALADLDRAARHALAVHRSKRADLAQWYDRLERLRSEYSERDPSRASLDGVLLRLEPFVQGETARMYGSGEGSIALEDFALPRGLAVLEGGEMDEYAKAVILSLIGWHLYQDAVVRRRQGLGAGVGDTPLFILYEEGNKVIAGVSTFAVEEGRPRASEVFQSQFRDAGKYNIFLGVIAQSPSELPVGILSSCNNLAVGQLKNPADRDVILPALGKSEKGFHDAPYARFVERMPQAMFVLKLGLSQDVADLEPMLFRPRRVMAREPSDPEIVEHFKD